MQTGLIPRYFFCCPKNGDIMDKVAIHIGELIRKIMTETGKKAKWLANKIGCVPDDIYWMWGEQYIRPERLIQICKHLETDFFACYSDYIRQQVPLPEISHQVDDEIHIGILIKSTVNENGIKSPWLAKQIGCSSSQLYRMYGYKHIKIEKLISLCILLKTPNISAFTGTIVLKNTAYHG
jgi:DNA-binding Xre family transcriptional regulator